MMPQAHIATALRSHQKRLQLGDKLPSMTELARRSGMHRDTLYEALNGRRISQVSQIRLSLMLSRLEAEEKPPSRLMHVRIGSGQPTLGFGVGPVGARQR
jgi:DNA-binding FadR family transcriptional regulator